VAAVLETELMGNDASLVRALRGGQAGAASAFYDRYAEGVMRTLRAILGADADVPDLAQEVFMRAIERIGDLDHCERVRSWLTTIAVFTARDHMRRRQRRNWLGLFSPDYGRALQHDPPPPEARFALREICDILQGLPLDERMAFLVRVVEGASLPDGAAACTTSLATFKRRLARAEEKFLDAVRDRPTLRGWLQEGTRWAGEMDLTDTASLPETSAPRARS
jgi:RNA polymerase sigma-70 factor (ECF subfamily)